MELQWKTETCQFLRCHLREVQNLEQTLELRLTEGMPDIGRVLWTWGQVCLRGKTWRSDQISASGGIQVWVLYAPEDGSEPRCVEGWLPFQGKWGLADSRNEGNIRIDALLRDLEARTLSARKMMVRGCVAVLAEVLEPEQAEITKPDEVPEGVQIYRQSYPLCLCREAGEMEFAVEESLELPSTSFQKLLCCRAYPVLTEQTVVGTRVVVRGYIRISLVYADGDGRIRSNCQEVPFAQFADLEGSYDKDAIASVVLAVSDVSCEPMEGQLQVHCSLVAQYVVRDLCLLELAQDAYSPVRKTVPALQQLHLPVMLDQFVQPLDAEIQLPALPQDIVDVLCLVDHPIQYRQEEMIAMEVPAVFRALYYDPEGNLQSASGDWSGHWQIPVAEGCGVHLSITNPECCKRVAINGQLTVSDALLLHVQTVCDQNLNMVTGLDVGDMVTPDPNRPSLILRRAGELSLWELAKGCGSTMEAIAQANLLSGEPDPEKILLIPVI